nr:hypothetical protein [uncultured Carboxylicivirga sp.]
MKLNKKLSVLIIAGILFFGQIFVFRDYISPIQWDQIKVSGQACTCPDEKVVNGQLYLRTITPDSLKQYNLDYSEIYVTEKPNTEIDPMGVDLYIIKGALIGKERVSDGDLWNPKFRIDEWKEVDLLKDFGVKILVFVQLIVFIIIYGKIKKGA